MTTASVFIGTSLDGFIARADGNIDWLHSYGNDEAVEAYKEFIAGIDAVVIGRGTFETVLSFPGWHYKLPVFVLSRTLTSVPEKAVGKAEILPLVPTDVLGYLSEKGFKAAYIDGGKVIQSFLLDDLIDTLIVTKLPVLIGTGIPLFGPLEHDLKFEHLETQVCSNGMVRSHYKRVRS